MSPLTNPKKGYPQKRTHASIGLAEAKGAGLVNGENWAARCEPVAGPGLLGGSSVRGFPGSRRNYERRLLKYGPELVLGPFGFGVWVWSLVLVWFLRGREMLWVKIMGTQHGNMVNGNTDSNLWSNSSGSIWTHTQIGQFVCWFVCWFGVGFGVAFWFWFLFLRGRETGPVWGEGPLLVQETQVKERQPPNHETQPRSCCGPRDGWFHCHTFV